ncbi:MAG: response regulator [Candidatus Latescibacterota bacterium]
MIARTSGTRILMVDDEPQVLTAVEHLLEDEFEVVTTTDPRDGLRILRETAVAVVVADQRMPGLSGDRFLQQARKVSTATRVLITGYADLGDLVRAVNKGHIFAYVAKPWDPSELKVTIYRAAEHHRLESALQESEARLRGLVEHLPEGVLLLNESRLVRLANPVARGYLQVLAGAGEGQVLERLAQQPVDQVLAQAATLDVEHPVCEITVPGSPERVFEVAAAPVLGQETSGEWALLVREVTRQRQLLEQQQQQGRLAAVGQLAAGIAHDFNNLLTVITSDAQLLARRPGLVEEDREVLGHIVEQGKLGGQLIRQVLDFSRRREMQRHPLDMVVFTQQVLRLLQRTLPESIRLVGQVEAEPLVIKGNPTQLQQVVTNLAINARDAMAHSGELRVGLSSLVVRPGELAPVSGMASGRWVLLSVADTGPGMSEEVLEHAFEPFFTTKGPGQDSGLGLAQAYGIVKQHGGEISVDSAPQRGTTFRIYLPAAEPEPGTPVRSGFEAPAGRGETVLLVEDQAAVRQAVERLLRGLNYQVLTAVNGVEALQVHALRADEIALVLTDMVMPEMGGAELCRALRQRAPHLPVVVMSGYPLAVGGGAESLPEGLAGFLEKPLTVEAVAQTLQAALAAQRTGR